jgi:predicted transcriptional regulator
VRKEFNEAGIINLSLICGCFNMFNRITDSLKMPIEIQPEIDKIKASVHLDLAKVKTYLTTVVEKWPSSFPAANLD